MTAIRLDVSTERRLDTLAKVTGRTKSYYIRRAIKEFLADREDYLMAVARLEEKNPTISIEELRKSFDLDD